MTTNIETILENDFGGYARISDEFESFANDLAVYATKWTPRCQNMIVGHARELFEDATMRTLVDMYVKAKAEADKRARSEFVRACIGKDAGEVTETTPERDKLKAYETVLDDLIFFRYCCD